MRNLLLSAATLALLAVPAMAQPEAHGSRDRAVGREQPAQAPQAAPAAAPAAPQAAPAAPPRDRGGDRGARGGNRGSHAPVAQPAAPVAQPQTRGNTFGGNRGGNQDAGRSDRGNRPGFDNRPGNNGVGNRPGNSGFGNRPGVQRNDYSNFRDYHRGFNAPQRFRAPSYRRPQGWYARRWSFGDFLPSLFWGQQYWLNDYMDYDLPPPPPGTLWVRYGNDALLIDRYTGEIITVEYGVFY